MKCVFFLVLSLLLVSCKHTNIYLLDEDELTWADAYEDGDVVLFKSSDNVDTMYVNKRVDNKVGMMGICILATYHGGIRFSNTLVHGGDSIEVFFLLMNGLDDGFIDITMNFNNRYFDASLQTRNADKKLPMANGEYAELGTIEELHSKSYVINGIVYNDLIIINDSNSHISMNADNNCEYFIWSKSKGLIQYKYEDGAVYDFYKKFSRTSSNENGPSKVCHAACLAISKKSVGGSKWQRLCP